MRERVLRSARGFRVQYFCYDSIKQQMQPIYSQHGPAITPAQPRDDISDDSEGDDDDDDDLPSGASWRELQPDVLNFSLPPGLAAKAK